MATVQEPRPVSRHDAFVETQLARALSLLGIEAPEKM